MPTYKYAVEGSGIDKGRSALATGREMPISPKHAREICLFIKGKKLDQTLDMLDDVINLKRSVPMFRHNKKGAHRKDLLKWHSGRYPVKACKFIRRVVVNLRANAENKQLNIDNCHITYAVSHRGRKLKRSMSRSRGSTSPKIKILTHVELVAEQLY